MRRRRHVVRHDRRIAANHPQMPQLSAPRYHAAVAWAADGSGRGAVRRRDHGDGP
jgi:hypothetical protein